MPIQTILLLGVDASDAIGHALRAAGNWEVIVVPLGTDMVEGVEAARPDLIVFAPGSAECCPVLERLRAGKRTARIPVVLLGDTSVQGTVGALPLPLDPETLKPQVQRLFEEGKLRSQLARLEDLGGVAFLHEMIGLFLESAPQRLDAMRAGLRADDLNAVERAAHALKSSAGNLGLEAAYALSGEIERQSAARQAEDVPALVERLRADLDLACARLVEARGAKP
ncbi:MAG: response regulator [Gemmataceae bacterium]|nr:response regulator [Gemmataceae bacterium]